jgi:hypothetical protein
MNPAINNTGAGVKHSRSAVLTGYVLSGLVMLFLAVDAAMKVFGAPAAVQGTVAVGYPANTVLPIGLIEVACLIVYLIPRTTVLGAVLWTGYLGGAVATHVRAGQPLFTHILAPVYVGALLWAGLWLRDARVKTMLAPR